MHGWFLQNNVTKQSIQRIVLMLNDILTVFQWQLLQKSAESITGVICFLLKGEVHQVYSFKGLYMSTQWYFRMSRLKIE